VQLDQPPRQRQADTQPGRAAFERGVGLHEHIEYFAQHLGRDADAVVTDADRQLLAVQRGVQRELAIAVGVLGGVVEQVGQHLRQACAVAAHIDRRRRQLHGQRVAERVQIGPHQR
jgi:hypothetical protein